MAETNVARLAHARVAHPSIAPSRYALLVHGVLGQGSNLRTLAKRLVERRPEWGFVLVDLRGHGRSELPAGPHTVAAAASDVAELVRALEAGEGVPRLKAPVAGAIGHSLGGKVVLSYASARAHHSERDPSRALDELWVLDASPAAQRSSGDVASGARRGVAWNVVAMLRRLEPRFESRSAFVSAVVAAGYSRAIADWLAMNVRPDGGDGYVSQLDLDAISALLDDYFEQDFLADLGGASTPLARRVHFVLGGASDAVPPSVRSELDALATSGRLSVHVLEGAGHWVHAEALDALVDVIGTELG